MASDKKHSKTKGPLETLGYRFTGAIKSQTRQDALLVGFFQPRWKHGSPKSTLLAHPRFSSGSNKEYPCLLVFDINAPASRCLPLRGAQWPLGDVPTTLSLFVPSPHLSPLPSHN